MYDMTIGIAQLKELSCAKKATVHTGINSIRT